jgi:periplasmic divalent cation tolerance protein
MCIEAEHVVALVTAPPDSAPELARRIVEEKLAACVNVVAGVRSIYVWKGKVCDEGEALLVIKTRAALFEALRARVVELHPYEVPEVIELPILAGHTPYLKWLDDSTRR